MPREEIETRIKATIPDAILEFNDLAGDNDHWQVTVTSAVFAGLPRIRQHQLVYNALGADMGTTLHALSVKTVIKT